MGNCGRQFAQVGKPAHATGSAIEGVSLKLLKVGQPWQNAQLEYSFLMLISMFGWAFCRLKAGYNLFRMNKVDQL
jgi:hypothetical protein